MDKLEGGAQASELNYIKELEDELKQARETNRDLHRRIQKIEAPAQSYEMRLKHAEQMWVGAWRAEFNRVCNGHQEIARIFSLLCSVYEYPGGGQIRHSVMDSKFPGGKLDRDGAVYANLFASKKGGDGGSYRVLDEVQKLVWEVQRLREECYGSANAVTPVTEGVTLTRKVIPEIRTWLGQEPTMNTRSSVLNSLINYIEELERVSRYADTVELILRENGWPGKADALRSRITSALKKAEEAEKAWGAQE